MSRYENNAVIDAATKRLAGLVFYEGFGHVLVSPGDATQYTVSLADLRHAVPMSFSWTSTGDVLADVVEGGPGPFLLVVDGVAYPLASFRNHASYCAEKWGKNLPATGEFVSAFLASLQGHYQNLMGVL